MESVKEMLVTAIMKLYGAVDRKKCCNVLGMREEGSGERFSTPTKFKCTSNSQKDQLSKCGVCNAIQSMKFYEI